MSRLNAFGTCTYGSCSSYKALLVCADGVYGECIRAHIKYKWATGNDEEQGWVCFDLDIKGAPIEYGLVQII